MVCTRSYILIQDYQLENIYDLRDSFLKLKEHDRKIPLPDSEEQVLCNLHEISKVEYLWYLSHVQLTETLGILQHKFYMLQSKGVHRKEPKMGMLARISSHAKDESFLMQCSRLPSWLNAKVTISVAVTRIFRYLSQASVDSDPLVVKYMRDQNGILMGIITRYRSQDEKSVLDTQTVSIDGNKTQATFKLVPSEGTAEDGVASQNSSSPRPPSNPATDPDNYALNQQEAPGQPPRPQQHQGQLVMMNQQTLPAFGSHLLLLVWWQSLQMESGWEMGVIQTALLSLVRTHVYQPTIPPSPTPILHSMEMMTTMMVMMTMKMMHKHLPTKHLWSKHRPASPDQASPDQASPVQASHDQGSPDQASPVEASPAQASPVQGPPPREVHWSPPLCHQEQEFHCW
jgi:hypothetical protein